MGAGDKSVDSGLTMKASALATGMFHGRVLKAASRNSTQGTGLVLHQGMKGLHVLQYGCPHLSCQSCALAKLAAGALPKATGGR